MRSTLPLVLAAVAFAGCGAGVGGTATTTTTTSGGTPSTTIPASPASTPRQAADIFYAAYRAGDRARALTVSTPQAVNELTWSADAGSNPTLSLTCERPNACFIYYEGGGINLVITGSAATGYRVTDVEPVAD